MCYALLQHFNSCFSREHFSGTYGTGHSNNGMYQQVDADGNRLGIILAIIFLGFKESLFTRVPRPFCYWHYVDDTFCYFSILARSKWIFPEIKQFPFNTIVYHGGRA